MAKARLAWRWPARYTRRFEEFGMSPCTLLFADKHAEVGFAAKTSASLAWALVLVGSWIGGVEFSFVAVSKGGLQGAVMPHESAAEFEVRMACLNMNLAIGAIGIVLALVGGAQMRWGPLAARSLELIVVMLLLLILVPGTLSAPMYIAKFVGHSELADPYGDEAFVMLMFNCVITVGTLLPVRWSNAWLLSAGPVVWYPLVRFAVFGNLPGLGRALCLLFLGSASMLAKRNVEMQDRRWFRTVAMERTQRARTEFMLSQPRSSGDVEVRSQTPTLESSVIFDETSAAQDPRAALNHIRATAEKEHWLIAPEHVAINVMRPLGRGCFGAVVEGSLSGLPVAVKLSATKAENEQAKAIIGLLTELRVLRKIRHPNVVLFHGAVIDQTLCEVALILEFIFGPNLEAFVLKQTPQATPLPNVHLYNLACGTAQALSCLHGHLPSIIHGDLKPCNIMVEFADSPMPRAKVVDFGLSRILSGTARTLGGTVQWVAPEVIQGIRPPSASADVYGFGRIILFMLTKSLPFPGMSPTEIATAVMSGNHFDEQRIPITCSDFHAALTSIAEMCTSFEPAERPSMEQVCNSLRDLGCDVNFKAGMEGLARQIWGSTHAFHRSGSGVSILAAESSAVVDSGKSGSAQSVSQYLGQLDPWEHAVPRLRAFLNRPAGDRRGGGQSGGDTDGEGGRSGGHIEAPGPLQAVQETYASSTTCEEVNARPPTDPSRIDKKSANQADCSSALTGANLQGVSESRQSAQTGGRNGSDGTTSVACAGCHDAGVAGAALMEL